MADKRIGWEVFCGVSCTTIQNGMYAKEFAPTSDGGDGTLVADIEVFIPELTPQSDGTEPEKKIIQDIKLWNPFTREDETAQITATHIIRCKYMGTQNFYVPCVHRGEQVWVLRHEGSEFQYYWLPMGRDEGMRNFEHLRWYAHNMPTAIQKVDEKHGIKTTVTDDNTYFIDIDTQRDKNGDIKTAEQYIASATDANGLAEVMGNLNCQTWDELWNSPEAEKVRKKVRCCDRDCWMIGSVSPAMHKYIGRVIPWVMSHKLKSMVGMKYSMYELPVCRDYRDGKVTKEELDKLSTCDMNAVINNGLSEDSKEALKGKRGEDIVNADVASQGYEATKAETDKDITIS